jgi:hypothetical protein
MFCRSTKRQRSNNLGMKFCQWLRRVPVLAVAELLSAIQVFVRSYPCGPSAPGNTFRRTTKTRRSALLTAVRRPRAADPAVVSACLTSVAIAPDVGALPLQRSRPRYTPPQTRG